MNNKDVNKFLTEQLGECWLSNMNYLENDFFTWTGFGLLWEWATKQEWWNHFMNDQSGKMVCFEVSYHLINPTNFANAIYEFLKEK